MANKLITADEILARKNFVKPKFNSLGFNTLVAQYFLTHDISAKLSIVSVRFVELQNPPECGYIDRTEEGYWEREWAEGRINVIEYNIVRQKGLYPPSIAVDVAFCKNAVYMLSVMGGYIVEKKRGKYVLTLV